VYPYLCDYNMDEVPISESQGLVPGRFVVQVACSVWSEVKWSDWCAYQCCWWRVANHRSLDVRYRCHGSVRVLSHPRTSSWHASTPSTHPALSKRGFFNDNHPSPRYMCVCVCGGGLPGRQTRMTSHCIKYFCILVMDYLSGCKPSCS